MTKRSYRKTGRGPQLLFRVIRQSATLTEEDTAWFAVHPDRLFRARLAYNAEVAACRTAGYEPPAGARVAIAMRYLRSSDMLLYEVGAVSATDDPSDFDDRAAEAFFDHCMGRKKGGAS